MNIQNSKITFGEALSKLERYCSYQERCHFDVLKKLHEIGISSTESEKIIVHLIESNFLNEERFACSFARGKHSIKKWGKVKIINELKSRKINQTLINIALKEINEEEYFDLFEYETDKNWNSITEKNSLKKRKKFCDYFLRRGWESDLIYQRVKDLENSNL